MSRVEGSSSAATLLHDYRTFAGPRLWAALALMLLGALAEGFGLLMIVPLASIATGEGSAWLSRFAFIPEDVRFLVALALFVAFMAARSLLLYAREVTLARLHADYEASLRFRAAATLSGRGWPFASRIGQAGMQSLLLTDVPRAALAVDFAQQMAVAIVMLAVQLALTLVLSPPLALIALAILLSGSLVAAAWARRGGATGIALTERSEESTGSGFRLHAGLKAALAQGSVPQFLDEYAASLAGARDETVRFSKDLNRARQWAAFAAAIAAALLLFVGVRVLALPFPILIAALALFARMVPPAQVIQQSMQYVATYAQSFAAIQRRLGTLQPNATADASAAPLDWRELRLDQVAFDHRPGRGLSACSLVLRRGEWIGIEGPSAAGKTTLIDIIAGLLPPDAGDMRVDGETLVGSRLEQWRGGLAYVGQDGTVFNDSVRGNLLAGAAVRDDEIVWRALELVGLAERVRAFDGALDEPVGDRGSQLSGGERQRLVLARGLLRSPTLLILDEATAALDSGGEGELFERLRAVEPRPAALVIAHRPSTLAHCDSVVSIRHQEEKSGKASGLAG
ncbi:ATP-binding cassette domain-containing protein [Sphingomonas sp. URHD0057]|uniref:ATP-binding cassette domain-containing protein n=1 Tax=Sphingomonas sp. URHD0057 TaxID=1380389 RepID=UPI00048D45C8|nr:ABC transporter ATP-binding protein [Sphingomonas sp. URHD0057]